MPRDQQATDTLQTDRERLEQLRQLLLVDEIGRWHCSRCYYGWEGGTSERHADGCEARPLDDTPPERSAAAHLPSVLAENARLRSELLSIHQLVRAVHDRAVSALAHDPAETYGRALETIRDATAPR